VSTHLFQTSVNPQIARLQCLSGRGDKDVEQISKLLPNWADTLDWHVALRAPEPSVIF